MALAAAETARISVVLVGHAADRYGEILAPDLTIGQGGDYNSPRSANEKTLPVVTMK